MRKKMKKKKGLTLLELVIVLGLMGIVTAIVFSFVNVTQRKSKELDIRQELQFEGTMITESMMGNVLEMKSIDSIGNDLTSIADGNKISFIEFELSGVGQYKNKPELNKVSKIRYVIDETTNEMKLEAFQLNGTVDSSGVKLGDWKLVSIVSEYIKEMTIENKTIKDKLTSTTTMTEDEMKELLAKEKSVNLKIVLEDDYYNETIEHRHTIELSLRNAK